MTPERFRQTLATASERELLTECLLDDAAPFAFGGDQTAWDDFCGEMGEALKVPTAAFRVVGSGRFGFSMKPGRNLRAFRDTSDIDVVVVDETLFDDLWTSLLAAIYPRGPMVRSGGGWLRNARMEISTGWLTPLGVKIDRRIIGTKADPVLQIKERWFDAFKSASAHISLAHEDVKGRLYRSWRHAELYHTDSLRALRKTLAEEQS